MAGLDEFESIFKAASKERYVHGDVRVAKVLVVTDLDMEASRLFLRDTRELLEPVLGEVEYSLATGAEYDDAGQLLEFIESSRADLIVSYRNLKSRAKSFPFSLGALVDVMTQATTTPVLLLPDPTPGGRLSSDAGRLARVMVLTDHLTGSAHLVDWGVRFTESGGTLLLVHLEDDVVFQRYMTVISKIPSLDTETAERDIRARLLREPGDYAASIQQELERDDAKLRVECEVTMGHRVGDVKRLAEAHQAALVVLNTKDEEQLAMHGLAYPLAIELRHVSLLLL